MAEMHSIIDIAAPAERVWQSLTDFEDYPRWNPFIRYLTGELTVGVPLVVYLAFQDGRIRRLDAQVAAIEPEREIRWMGRLEKPYAFDLEHALRIEPLDEGSARFSQQVAFRGLLAPFWMRVLQKRLQRGFSEMNQALKEQLEVNLPPEGWFRNEPVAKGSRQG
jgi:hypothetical protein